MGNGHGKVHEPDICPNIQLLGRPNESHFYRSQIGWLEDTWVLDAPSSLLPPAVVTVLSLQLARKWSRQRGALFAHGTRFAAGITKTLNLYFKQRQPVSILCFAVEKTNSIFNSYLSKWFYVLANQLAWLNSKPLFNPVEVPLWRRWELWYIWNRLWLKVRCIWCKSVKNRTFKAFSEVVEYCCWILLGC